jgi:rhodanese-related sulfurtransferase
MTQLRPTISAADLYALTGTARAPVVVDIRPVAAYESDRVLVAGAVRRDPAALADPLVLCCAQGAESATLAASLAARGRDVRALAGGLAAWRAAGLPTCRGLPAYPSRWVTRERPKVDRIACPWLVRRFIDPTAEFLYVPPAEVARVAEAEGAMPFDVEGARFGHVGEACSFDAFLRLCGIADRALDRLALIVRGADTGRPDLTPQSPGLLALSHGLSATIADDHKMLEHGMVLYDALYAWCRSAAA